MSRLPPLSTTIEIPPNAGAPSIYPPFDDYWRSVRSEPHVRSPSPLAHTIRFHTVNVSPVERSSEPQRLRSSSVPARVIPQRNSSTKPIIFYVPRPCSPDSPYREPRRGSPSRSYDSFLRGLRLRRIHHRSVARRSSPCRFAPVLAPLDYHASGSPPRSISLGRTIARVPQSFHSSGQHSAARWLPIDRS